jgi:excisionase family DNA binding protein
MLAPVTRTRLLSLAQAAHLLGVGRKTLARWIADGRVPAVRTPGGRYRLDERDLVLAFTPARRHDDDGRDPERRR